MIKIENAEVFGWESAIRGMRNPMNSWDKSDSDFHHVEQCSDCEHYGKSCHPHISDGGTCAHIGENDLKLMKRLVKAGTDHAKFMRMINVTCDIIAPLYWWKEADTYKVGTVRNSCSTMHKIQEKELTLDDFSHEHLLTEEETEWGNICPTITLECTISALNNFRKRFLETKDKKYWWQMIQLLPSSYNQRSTLQINYAVLRNMYHSRKSHKLDEWRDFCKWIESLPYSELITDKEEND